jgi:hypothetical protein
MMMDQVLLRLMLMMVVFADGDFETLADVIYLFAVNIISFFLKETSIQMGQHACVFIHDCFRLYYYSNEASAQKLIFDPYLF